MYKIEITGESVNELQDQLKSLLGLFSSTSSTIASPLWTGAVLYRENEKASYVRELPTQPTNAEKAVQDLKLAAPSLDDCRAIYIKATEAGVDKASIKQILTDLKVARITALGEEVRGEFIKRVNELIKNAK